MDQQKNNTSIVLVLFVILTIPMSVFAVQSGGGYIVYDQVSNSLGVNASVVSSLLSPTPSPTPSVGGGGGGGVALPVTTNIPINIPIINSSLVFNPPVGQSQNTNKNVGTAPIVQPALFDITLSSEGLRSSAAPGESIAFSVKLVNLGSQRRADVTITYRLLDSNAKQIYAEEETVAVDTTASFVKRLPIPKEAKQGSYTIESSLSYAGQKAPAVSRFTFTVASAIPSSGGINTSLIVGGITIAAFLILFAGLFIGRRRQSRFVVHDYSDKPREERIYYEIISDTIGQMRQRAGDQALEVAAHIGGLTIDEKTGRVLKITDSPPKIITSLVSGYEQALGKKVSFSLRREKENV